MQTVYCNVTFRRIRAVIVAVEKEYILHTVNMNFYTKVTSTQCACALYSFAPRSVLLHFFKLSHTRHNLLKKIHCPKMCVLKFSRNIF